MADRKSTRLNSSHANIYTLSLHDALPIYWVKAHPGKWGVLELEKLVRFVLPDVSSKNRLYDLVQLLGWLPFALMWIGLAFGTSKMRMANSLRDPKWQIGRAHV